MSVAAVAPDSETLEIDQTLFRLDREIDWLSRVSPTGNRERWIAFRSSGFTTAPALTYKALGVDPDSLLERIDEIPLETVDQPTYAILLTEKAMELRRQVLLLDSRNTHAFTTASVQLFGGTDPSLLADAVEILDTVPERPVEGSRVGAERVLADARNARSGYRSAVPDLAFDIRLVEDTDAKLMVHQGDLLIDADLRLPEPRVRALVAHEVGVHVLTRYNGRRQPLTLLQSGLAHYDGLQEGLATLCEFLSGCLPPSRLRELAARVVAADMAVRHEPLEAIFARLQTSDGIPAEAAFEVAVRAKRGGGLTKDAVYLAGLRDLLAWLDQGGDITQLFLGKYSLADHHLIAELLDQGLLVPPAVLPTCVTSPAGKERLEAARGRPLNTLYQTEFTT